MQRNPPLKIEIIHTRAIGWLVYITILVGCIIGKRPSEGPFISKAAGRMHYSQEAF
eukprot:c2422_g1_i1 orf=312-479(+)